MFVNQFLLGAQSHVYIVSVANANRLWPDTGKFIVSLGLCGSTLFCSYHLPLNSKWDIWDAYLLDAHSNAQTTQYSIYLSFSLHDNLSLDSIEVTHTR